MGTIGQSDIYGRKGPGYAAGDTELQTVNAASGSFTPSTGKGPAVSWVGIVLILVALRAAWELAG